jgi:hypothetical protein
MALTKKPKDYKCWQECGEKETLAYTVGGCKSVQLLWKL